MTASEGRIVAAGIDVWRTTDGAATPFVKISDWSGPRQFQAFVQGGLSTPNVAIMVKDNAGEDQRRSQEPGLAKRTDECDALAEKSQCAVEFA